ncbi:unnamed protein product [Dibothriocephalus latus]|uniref:Ion transport domain-containing protein n=1 Tax=Dibothriocephalus latus TaxID=60516 RepID=A0A3P7LF85_DIBLA|nr:unnamed protein product [Dibothriocephalus latus]
MLLAGLENALSDDGARSTCAVVKGRGFKQYLSSRWNLGFWAFTCLFILGNLISVPHRGAPIWLPRFFLAICLMSGFVLLFRYLVVIRSIGPKLLMIKKMVLGDLIPFLVIIIIFWTAFTIFLVVTVYKPPTNESYGSQMKDFLTTWRNMFFAMFGEFNIGDNVDELGMLKPECSAADGCTYPTYKGWYPFVYAVYVVCTHVILLNLLIAMFT